ncbi:MAG: hypothetical protein HQL06_05650 [Nitrospirae bacterium]|nr:hypothetical protein [Nitrospirota bacterium]
MKTTSDEITYEQQNLWIIDEKLSYHNYLASDVPLNKLENVSIDSEKRPDIIIFNNPFAFVDGESSYSSIVIIEFKRPGRNTYTEEDNPIGQIYGYIRKIIGNKAKDKDGRPILINKNTRFYAYILCDFTEKLITLAEDNGMTKSPDDMGYFNYNSNLKTYLEIISFDKLIQDASKRNRVLFDKLNLHS